MPQKTLKDHGYRNVMSGCLWEKILSYAPEKEVVSEIIVPGKSTEIKEPMMRVRTVFFEETDYGKSSRKIEYETVPLTGELLEAAKETWRENTTH